ncbi:MAG: DMT family transporter [Opitutales bacterium]|nr:DMT family transporter [Opitutales bacterium]
MLNHPITVKAALAAFILTALWGGNTPSIKVALEGLPPLALAGVRFTIGALTVLVWVLYERIPLKPKPGEYRLLFFLTILFVLQIYSLHLGTQFTQAAHSGVFVCTAPFFIALLAHYFLPDDRLSVPKIAGMLCSLLGIVIIFAEGFLTSVTDYLIGDAIVLISGFLLGARQIYTKRLTQSMHPAKLLFWQATFSIPIFFALSALLERGQTFYVNRDIALAIAYQGIVIAGFCFIFWTILLRRYNASKLGAFAFVSPISGVAISYWLLSEPITSALIFGVLLVGLGIAITTYPADSKPGFKETPEA